MRYFSASSTFVSPFLPELALGPSSIIMLIWLGIIAWQNGTIRRHVF